MPFIEVDLKDAREQEVVAEGLYPLKIIKAEDKESKAGNPMTEVTIQIVGKDYAHAAPIRHWLLAPAKGDDPSIKQMRVRDLARFLQLFEVPYEASGFDSDDLVGATCEECLVIQEDGDDGNTYNRIRPPRLRTEPDAEEETDARPARTRRGKRR